MLRPRCRLGQGRQANRHLAALTGCDELNLSWGVAQRQAPVRDAFQGLKAPNSIARAAVSNASAGPGKRALKRIPSPVKGVTSNVDAPQHAPFLSAFSAGYGPTGLKGSFWFPSWASASLQPKPRLSHHGLSALNRNFRRLLHFRPQTSVCSPSRLPVVAPILSL